LKKTLFFHMINTPCNGEVILLQGENNDNLRSESHQEAEGLHDGVHVSSIAVRSTFRVVPCDSNGRYGQVDNQHVEEELRMRETVITDCLFFHLI
jgi:hypothetical protein